MPCINKFQSELELKLTDYAPTTLIVGTFIPDVPASTTTEWFYGNPANSCFWDVLPRLCGETSLADATAADWKLFCRNKEIAITNIIDSIDDADPDNPGHVKVLSSFSDAAIAHHFDDFNFVSIVRILQNLPSISNVYLTRGVTEAFWRHIWNPVMQYCSRNNLRERKLLTPSDSAAYQHEAYNKQHPDAQVPRLEDYILMRWKQEWHF